MQVVGVHAEMPLHLSLRGDYPTMRLMAGQKLGYAAGQMGHSVEMFTRTYARWLDGEQDRVELNKLELLTTASEPARKIA